VFENDDFITWSNENCVSAVGHNGATSGKDHDPIKQTDPKTKEEKEICPKYAGLTCAEHQAVRSAADSPPEGWEKMPESKGVPINAVFGPDGKVEKIDNVKALTAKSLIDYLTEYQKKFDKPIGFKKWDAYNKSFEEGDKALEEGKWKAALAAYLKVDADGKKLSKGLAEKVKAKVEAANAKVVEAFGKIKDGDGDAAAKLKAGKALRADVAAKFSSGALPVVADIDAWIKETTAAAAPAPAK
jgi:hypothetical protein